MIKINNKDFLVATNVTARMLTEWNTDRSCINNNKNPPLNFSIGTVLGDKKQGEGIRNKG